LPVKAAAPAAPSFIPIRHSSSDATITLKGGRNEDKELATLTRINTRKNKAGALSALDVLKRQEKEKSDPAVKHQLLKEAFDAKHAGENKDGVTAAVKDAVAEAGVAKKKKSVVWKEELVACQEFSSKDEVSKLVQASKLPADSTSSAPTGEATATPAPVKMTTVTIGSSSTKPKKKAEKKVSVKSTPVKGTPAKLKVGTASTTASKIALGMSVNGTPAPKRKLREPRVKATVA
jgi:hypothetical protein